MSFFRRNKRPHQRPPVTAKAGYDIICPYCFERYEPNKVVFRIDYSIKDDERFKKQSDLKLNEYRKSIGLDEITEIEAVIDPVKDSMLVKKRYEPGGVLLGITDINEKSTNNRLCPFCHKDVPITSGKGPTEVISLIGATSVGKTIYMTVLLKTLQDSTSGNFKAGCIPIASQYLDIINENEDRLFAYREVLPSNPKEILIEPLILTFNFNGGKKPPVTLIFYDVAGEGMKDKTYIEKHAAHIKNSTGIMFLIDPLQIKTIEEKIKIIKNLDDDIDLSTNLNLTEAKTQQSRRLSPQAIITMLFQNFIGAGGVQETGIPTSVIISKSDMLDVLEGKIIRESTNILKNYKHKGVLSVDQINLINKEVEDFLREVDGAFINSMDSFFKEKNYFAVSALGSNPINSKIEDAISPVRIDEPFLWLLHKWGYIESDKISSR